MGSFPGSPTRFQQDRDQEPLTSRQLASRQPQPAVEKHPVSNMAEGVWIEQTLRALTAPDVALPQPEPSVRSSSERPSTVRCRPSAQSRRRTQRQSFCRAPTSPKAHQTTRRNLPQRTTHTQENSSGQVSHTKYLRCGLEPLVNPLFARQPFRLVHGPFS